MSFHKNGGIKTEKAIIIDFEHPERNDFS
ncbi:hypothetical protein NSS59_09925 [Caldifermentibacillus hisashii]